MARCAAILAVLLLLTGMMASAPALPAEVLSLERYLTEVARSNPGYRGLREDSEGRFATAEAGALAFEPQAFADITYINDTRNTQAPAIEGDKSIRRSLSVGVRKQFDFGLQLQLSYELDQTSLLDVNGQLVAQPDFQLTYISPQFNLSLWQNFLGRADRASARLSQAQARAEAYQKDFEARALLADAEGRYWRLAVTREVSRLERESLERAAALQGLDTRKAARHLADRADLLLAQAAVKGKALELSQAEDDVRSAAQALNGARGVDSEEVAETLPLPSPEVLRQLAAPIRSGRRGDVLAAEQASLARTAGGELAREKLLPSLNLYGSIYAIGLNLSVPLDLPLTSRVRSGYAREIDAAELLYQRKTAEQDTEWRELSRKMGETLHRYELALELEGIQREKFENARVRRERGLSIADQVFQYELDYLNSALSRVQLEGAILGLRTRLKTYGGDS